VSVDFAQLRNNRIDSQYTNPIVLTLYVTVARGPAADGYTLCSVTVPGLYAGSRRDAPGFDCVLNSVPDGTYTAHLAVAEQGGRGGESTLSGPDLSIRTGHVDYDFSFSYSGDGVYFAGATTPATLFVLLLLLALRVAQRKGLEAWRDVAQRIGHGIRDLVGRALQRAHAFTRHRLRLALRAIDGAPGASARPPCRASRLAAGRPRPRAHRAAGPAGGTTNRAGSRFPAGFAGHSRCHVDLLLREREIFRLPAAAKIQYAHRAFRIDSVHCATLWA
jgi:hypothetical protein